MEEADGCKAFSIGKWDRILWKESVLYNQDLKKGRALGYNREGNVTHFCKNQAPY